MQTTNHSPIIPVFMALCLLTSLSAAQFAGGTGEAGDPYQIATAEQLVSVGSDPNLADKHFVLTADIDLDPNLPGGKVFDRAVIAADLVDLPSYGYSGTVFSGVFDGGGHVISNLTIRGEHYLGLFGIVSGAVEDVRLVNVDISGTASYVGALAGVFEGTATRCHSDGAMAGVNSVGGLVGYLFRGRIIRCDSDAVVAAAGDCAGGLVGGTHDDAVVAMGGSRGAVSGRNYVGGLVGENSGGSYVVMSCSTGSAIGSYYVGGLIGENDGGTVSLSYSTGAASGESNIGGLIGYSSNSVPTHCYSAGLVTGGLGAGGLVGRRGGRGYLPSRGDIGCFWDVERSGQSTSGAGTGLTTVQMQNLSTFLAVGWDFIDETANGAGDVWRMTEGEYPQLRCFSDDAPGMPEGLGTVEEPYLIRDTDDLGVVWFEPAASYRLMASIDLSGIVWSVAVVPWFNGTLDGNGYAIANLHIQGGGHLGLIGETGSEAAIRNLRLDAMDVNGVGSYVGGLAGRNEGEITASSVTGVVTGQGYVGGGVGSNWGDIISSCSEGDVACGGTMSGGFAGYNSGDIRLCHSAGSLDAGDYSGGLVGANAGEIVASGSATDVGGDSCVGGLVGQNTGAIIEYSDGSWEICRGTVRECYSSGTVAGSFSVGGLVGENRNSVSVIASYTTSRVVGKKYVGGFAGYNYGGDIAMSYCTGAVTADAEVGGLVGKEWQGSTTSSFWDRQTCGQATSAAGESRTTAEMQTAATFLDAGWDFAEETANGAEDTWWIVEGQDYPRLWWEAEVTDATADD